MPTYEYQCQKCGHVFEAFQSITDEPLKECPVCKGPVKRLISSGAGLIFKGSGFYETDYKKKESTKETVKKDDGHKKDSQKEKTEKKNNSLKKD